MTDDVIGGQSANPSIPTCEAIAEAIRSAVPHVWRDAVKVSKRHDQDVRDGKRWFETHADVVRWLNSLTYREGGWKTEDAGQQLMLDWGGDWLHGRRE